LKLDGMQS